MASLDTRIPCPDFQPSSYAMLMLAADGDRFAFAFPDRIIRTGDRVFYVDARLRYSSRIPHEVIADAILAPEDPRQPQPHVTLPLLWAWAYGQRRKLPEHPAGELRGPWRQRFP